jgi:hypothetical protein
MSDEFGTVNVRKGERGKEIEAVRQQYRHHRDALVRMVADAPTEHLATEYQRLIRDIDTAIAKLDEIEGRSSSSASISSAGSRPLVTPPLQSEEETLVGDSIPPSSGEPSRQSSRVLMIVIAGVIVLVAIVWLLWRASGDRNKVPETATTVTTPVVETATPAPATTPAPVPAATSAVLKVTPLAANYGTIRKGTRAVRQFTIENSSGAPVKLKVARSACRCLFYDYSDKGVPAHGKDTLTVTVDGARAKAGALHETVQVSSKDDASVAVQFDVNATIQ